MDSGTNMVSDTPTGKRKRLIFGIAVAVVALLALATTAIAAGPGIRGFAPGGSSSTPGAGAKGGQNFGQNFGPRAVVTAVDATNQTITLGGLPQQIAAVKVDQTIQLVATQPDGTTKPAVFTDFNVGSLVDVHFKFNGVRPARGQGQPGTAQTPVASSQAKPMATITQLALVTPGQVQVQGLVTSTTGGLQIIDGGGLQLTINTGSATVTKGQNKTAASATDIKVGDRISVSGTQSGATVNATTIRIADLTAFGQPPMRPGMGKPAASPTTTP
jgi:hypothetical protein